jgi:hypothetical protein
LGQLWLQSRPPAVERPQGAGPAPRSRSGLEQFFPDAQIYTPLTGPTGEPLGALDREALGSWTPTSTGTARLSTPMTVGAAQAPSVAFGLPPVDVERLQALHSALRRAEADVSAAMAMGTRYVRDRRLEADESLISPWQPILQGTGVMVTPQTVPVEPSAVTLAIDPALVPADNRWSRYTLPDERQGSLFPWLPVRFEPPRADRPETLGRTVVQRGVLDLDETLLRIEPVLRRLDERFQQLELELRRPITAKDVQAAIREQLWNVAPAIASSRTQRQLRTILLQRPVIEPLAQRIAADLRERGGRRAARVRLMRFLATVLRPDTAAVVGFEGSPNLGSAEVTDQLLDLMAAAPDRGTPTLPAPEPLPPRRSLVKRTASPPPVVAARPDRAAPASSSRALVVKRPTSLMRRPGATTDDTLRLGPVNVTGRFLDTLTVAFDEGEPTPPARKSITKSTAVPPPETTAALPPPSSTDAAAPDAEPPKPAERGKGKKTAKKIIKTMAGRSQPRPEPKTKASKPTPAEALSEDVARANALLAELRAQEAAEEADPRNAPRMRLVDALPKLWGGVQNMPQLVERLHQLIPQLFGPGNGPTVVLREMDEGDLAAYYRRPQTIALSTTIPPELVQRALIHETVHAVLHRIRALGLGPRPDGLRVFGGDQQYQRVHNLLLSFNRVRELARTQFIRGYKEATGQEPSPAELRRYDNLEEFIAELYASPDLAQSLDRVIDQSENKTLWQRVKQIIRAIFETLIPDLASDRVLERELLDFLDSIGRAAGTVPPKLMRDAADGGVDGADFLKLTDVMMDAFNYVGSYRMPVELADVGQGVAAKARELSLALMGPYHLVSTYERLFKNDDQNALRDWYDLVNQRTSTATRWLRDYSQWGEKWSELHLQNPEQASLLSELMQKATLWDVYPDRPWDDPLNAGRFADSSSASASTARRNWELLSALWQKLSPEFQTFYTDIQQWLRGVWAVLLQEMAVNRLAALQSSTPLQRLSDDEAVRNPDQVFDNLRKAQATAKETNDGPALDALNELVGRMVQHGPYFPLRRFGDWFVIARSDVQTVIDWTAQDLAAAQQDPAFLLISQKQNADGTYTVRFKYYVFEAFESLADAKARHRQLAANPNFDEVVWKTADEAVMSGRFVPAGLLRIAQDQVAAVKQAAPIPPPDATPEQIAALQEQHRQRVAAAEEAQRAVARLLLELAPETSVRRLMARRLGIAGANPDMLRAFAAHGRAFSYALSQIRWAAPLNDALFRMRDWVRQLARMANAPEGTTLRPMSGADAALIAQQVVNELVRHETLLVENAIRHARNKVGLADRLGFAAFLHMLGSPAYWLTNATQPIVLTIPILGAKHGIARTIRTVTEVYRELTDPAKALVSTETKRLLRGLPPHTRSISVAEHLMAQLPTEERAMLNRLAELNRLDITMALEVNQLARRGATRRTVFSTILDWLIAAPHFVEVVNRIVTAVAAYRLAKTTLGYTPDQATAYAADMVTRTQLDYSMSGRPRLFLYQGLKPFLIFKLYGAHLYYLFFDYVAGALGKNPEIGRREAALALVGVSLAHALFAGLVGAAWEPAWLLIELAAWWSGEDARALVHEAASQILPDGLVEVAMRGLPGAAGVDMSRVSLHNLLVSTFGEKLGSQEGRAIPEQLVLNLFGVPLAMASSYAEGIQALMDGRTLHGVSRLMPVRFMRDVFQGMDWAQNGLPDRNGNPIMKPEDMTTGDWVLRMLGFNPTDITRRYELRAAVFTKAAALRERRTELLDQWWRIHKDKDWGAIPQFMSLVAAYNRENTAEPITADTLARSLRSRALTAKERAEIGVTGNLETTLAERYRTTFGVAR